MPIFSAVLKHWKIAGVFLLLASNIYAYHLVNSLKKSAYKDSIQISQLNSDINLLRLKVKEQNKAIEEGNVKYNIILKKQQASVTKISELNKSLTVALNTINSTVIGDSCEDKLEYLKQSSGDLKW